MSTASIFYLLSAAGVALLLALVVLAFLRARKTSRAELRALKELSRSSGLLFSPPNLFRGASLIGKWKGRATSASLGLDGLTAKMNFRAVKGQRTQVGGRATITYPAGKGSPTWGISTEFESTYDLRGDEPFLKELSVAFPSLETLRDLSGEFKLVIQLKGRKKDSSPASLPPSGRLTFQTAIVVGSAEQLKWMFDSLAKIAEFTETEDRKSERSHSTE